MKRIVSKFITIVMIFININLIVAQGTTANIASASVSATIINPITIRQSSDLHFGSMAVSMATPGTCTITTQGVRTSSGGVSPTVSGQSDASFVVTGEKRISYVITLPLNVTLTEPTSSSTITVSNLTARSVSSGSDGLIGTLNSNGEDKFTIGGTLNVRAGQTNGIYTGTFNVIVAYN